MGRAWFLCSIRFEPTSTQLVNEHSIIQLNWPVFDKLVYSFWKKDLWHPEFKRNLVVMPLIWNSTILFPSIDDADTRSTIPNLRVILSVSSSVSSEYEQASSSLVHSSLPWCICQALSEGHTFACAKWCFFHFLLFAWHFPFTWALSGLYTQKSNCFSCYRCVLRLFCLPHFECVSGWRL